MMLSSKRLWFYSALALIAACIAFGGQKVLAQTGDPRPFPETGHWVRGEFLVKYESAVNPAEVYGAPITEQFEDPLIGITVQYFEKARFELHPESPPGLRVRLTELGTFLYKEGQTLSTPASPQACKTFIQSEYAVCYAFLDFFEKNGGVAQFGYPISGFEIHDGRIVQYFQYTRLEWHPENPAGKRVTVSNLGYRYFYEHGEDPTLLNPLPNDQIPDMAITRLGVHAFTKFAVMPLNGEQTLYVIVQDQYHRPVEGVEVEFKVVLPDGSEKTYKADKTNDLGVSMLRFNVNSPIPGSATIFVTANYDQQTIIETTQTSFALWW